MRIPMEHEMAKFAFEHNLDPEEVFTQYRLGYAVWPRTQPQVMPIMQYPQRKRKWLDRAPGRYTPPAAALDEIDIIEEVLINAVD